MEISTSVDTDLLYKAIYSRIRQITQIKHKIKTFKKNYQLFQLNFIHFTYKFIQVQCHKSLKNIKFIININKEYKEILLKN